MEIDKILLIAYQITSNLSYNTSLYDNAIDNGLIKENEALNALFKSLLDIGGVGYEDFYIYCTYSVNEYYYILHYKYNYSSYEIYISEAEIKELYKLL